MAINGNPELQTQSNEASSARPTWVRWRVVFLLVTFSFMTWFNRVSMAVAYDERIIDQYSISEVAIGWVYSAFLIAYAVFMTPGGWFIDRFGVRFSLVIMGFGSALFGALTGVVGMSTLSASGVWLSFMVVRSLMGIFTAPFYPASARMISRWLPLQQRAWANGLVTSAALVGIASTYVVFGKLIDWFDWPRAFLVTGLLTVLLAAVWAMYVKDHPSQHGSVNLAERQLILDPQEEKEHLQTSRDNHSSSGGWFRLLANRSLLLLTLSYAAVGYFQYLFFFWMHYYFDEQLHLGKDESRYYAGIPSLAMAVGMVLGGLISDRLVKACGYRLGRVSVPIAGMALGAFFLFLGLLPKEPVWIVTWFALAMAAVGAAEGPFWTTAVELGGRRGGSSAGIVNTGGNVGGLIAPILTPLISQTFGWPWGISLGSFVCLLGVVLWFWIDPAERVPEKPIHE